LKVAVFSARSYDREFLSAANGGRHELTFIDSRLNGLTAKLAAGFTAVCAFVNDQLDAGVLRTIASGGTGLVALRSAGFNHVDIAAAGEVGVRIARVPAYSPHAVAEHTVALVLALNRRLTRAFARVRDGNFVLDHLLGFDLHGRTVGIVGTGRIGAVVARIMAGFGCRVLASDPRPDPELDRRGVTYVDFARLFAESDIITLHCPLAPATRHLIDDRAVAAMRPGVMLINTSRGALVDTRAVIAGLKSGRIGYLGLDVYEEEGDLFFRDLSDRVIQDDVFARLLTFPNVLITAHQAFFTREALERIAATTMENLAAFEEGRPLANEVTIELVRG
jgi:D-lactate dehydrogenase